jgi:hypothetical protein
LPAAWLTNPFQNLFRRSFWMRPFRLFRTVYLRARTQTVSRLDPIKDPEDVTAHKPEKSGKLRPRTGLEDGIRRDLIRFNVVTKMRPFQKAKPVSAQPVMSK